MGHHDWLRYHDALASRHALYVPSHPGFGGSERLEWMMNVRDCAGWYLDALDDLGLDRVSLLGFSPGRLAGRRDGRHEPRPIPQSSSWSAPPASSRPRARYTTCS